MAIDVSKYLPIIDVVFVISWDFLSLGWDSLDSGRLWLIRLREAMHNDI